MKHDSMLHGEKLNSIINGIPDTIQPSIIVFRGFPLSPRLFLILNISFKIHPKPAEKLQGIKLKLFIISARN